MANSARLRGVYENTLRDLKEIRCEGCLQHYYTLNRDNEEICPHCEPRKSKHGGTVHRQTMFAIAWALLNNP